MNAECTSKRIRISIHINAPCANLPNSHLNSLIDHWRVSQTHLVQTLYSRPRFPSHARSIQRRMFLIRSKLGIIRCLIELYGRLFYEAKVPGVSCHERFRSMMTSLSKSNGHNVLIDNICVSSRLDDLSMVIVYEDSTNPDRRT